VNSHSPSPCPGPAAPGESSNGPTMPFSQSLSTTAGCSPNYSPVSFAKKVSLMFCIGVVSIWKKIVFSQRTHK